MNYLEEALKTPDRNTLVLFDRYDKANESFRRHAEEAAKARCRIKSSDLTICFKEGGFLRFGVPDRQRYLGIRWEQVFHNYPD